MRIQSSRFKISSAAMAALPAVVAASSLLVPGMRASAAVTQLYDADTTAPANDGTGVWNTTTANWNNATNTAPTDTTYDNDISDTAIFGAATAGTGGTVTVGIVNVGTIQFNPQTTTGYTLSTGTITLGTGITTTSTVNSTINSKISGTNGLAFNGVAGAANGLSIGAASTNDYTGITALSTGGRLSIGTGTPLGSNVGATASALGSNYTVINTGTTLGITASSAEAFIINGTGSTASGNPNGAIRFAATLTLSSLVQLGSSSQITSNGSGPVTISGNLDLGAFNLGVGNGSLAFGAGKDLTISGVLSGTSASFLDIGAGGGANSVILTNNSNSFSGTTRINASSGTSVLSLGGDTVLGTGSLSFNGGSIQSTNATARTIANPITGINNTTFGALVTQTGALNFTNTTPLSIGFNPKTFTTNVNTTIAAGLTNGAGTFTKAGSATLFMNGVNSYTALTTVSAGTLAGTGTFASPITVASAAALAPATVGTTGVLTDNGAVAIVLSSGSTFNVDVQGLTAGSGYDQLSLTGASGDTNLTGANLVAAFSTFTPSANGGDVVYIINDVNAARTITGTFAGLADNATVGTFGGQTFLITYDANSATGSLDGGNDVALYTVAAANLPEPATLGAIAIGATTLLRRRRRA